MILAHGDPTTSPLSPHLHPDVVAFVVVLALAYWLALTRLGPRRLPAGEPAWTRRQARLLVVGIVTLWVFSDWPIHDLSEGYLYSVHMVQHSVYSLVLPPLFILGTPRWLWRWLLSPVMGAFRQLVRPWVAVSVFSAVTVATICPPSSRQPCARAPPIWASTPFSSWPPWSCGGRCSARCTRPPASRRPSTR